MTVSAAQLSRRAMNATTFHTVQVVDGWLLRAAPVPFRRANSAAVLHAAAAQPAELDRRLDQLSRFAARHGQNPRVQLAPPPLGTGTLDALDAALAERGWEIEAPVSVQTATCETVRERLLDASGSTPVDLRAEVLEPGSEGKPWGGDGMLTPGAERISAFTLSLAAIGPASVDVRATAGDATVAAGVGVIEDGWVGVFGMQTHPAHRRRGAARAVLARILEAAAQADCTHCYLQVEPDNATAAALYQQLGFVEHHRYHYRRAP